MTRKTLAEEYVAEARRELAACLVRVKHCMGQLDDGQVWHRPRPGMHSVGDLVLHLCGSLRQRLLSVVGGARDDRDRTRGFAGRGPAPKAELLLQSEEAVGAVDAVLAGLTADRLLEGRRYAGLREEARATVLVVVLRTLMRFRGHAQEVVYASRLLLGEGYRFLAPAVARKQVIDADDVVFERGLIPPLPASPAPPAPVRQAVADAGSRAVEGAGTAPSESPLHDHLLECEQEFQDQEAEGKV